MTGPRVILESVESPYREPRPLSEVIAPDRRRERTAILVITSMIAGAALWELARWALEERDSIAAPSPARIEFVPAEAPAPPPIPAERTAVDPMAPSLTSDEVERVVAGQRARVKQQCWGPESSGPRINDAKVTLSLIVGAKGNVVAASATGTDALVASCVETQARTWLFPAHGERSATIQIPFVFRRS